MTTTTTRQYLEDARALEADHIWHAEKILEVLESQEGKKLTRRILPRIAAVLGQQVTLDWVAGGSLLYITTAAYSRDCEACGFGAIKLLIPTAMGQDTLPEINTAEIRERNSCYLEAAVERNAQRERLLAADYPERCDAAGEQYRSAKQALEALTCYPNPNWVQLQKLQGLK